MRKFALVLSLLALAMFALAACGDDDDDDEPAAETTTTEETTEAAGGGGGGEATSLTVTADPGGQLAYEEDSLEAPAGEVTIELTNDASVPHDVCIESPEGEDVGCAEEVTGGTSSVTADVSEPGEYTFYCSVDAHREAGMEGPFTVE
jgi:plastocyanin